MARSNLFWCHHQGILLSSMFFSKTFIKRMKDETTVDKAGQTSFIEMPRWRGGLREIDGGTWLKMKILACFHASR